MKEDEVCSDGACRERSCDPGKSRCGADGVFTCDEIGLGESFTACGTDERCDEGEGVCVELACEPNARVCMEETIGVCAADGSRIALTKVDCAAQDEQCWNGECESQVCSEEFVCRDGASLRCVDNGTRLEPVEDCDFDRELYCNPDTGRCESWRCEAGKPTCNGELVTSCADDGSGPLDVGIDCAARQQVCWEGSCRTQLCTDEFRCDGERLLRCLNHGTAFKLEKECAAGSVCDAAAGTCRLQLCEPSKPACDGSVATECETSGLGYSGARLDCAERGQGCSRGQCKPLICNPNSTFCRNNEVSRCDLSERLLSWSKPAARHSSVVMGSRVV